MTLVLGDSLPIRSIFCIKSSKDEFKRQKAGEREVGEGEVEVDMSEVEVDEGEVEEDVSEVKVDEGGVEVHKNEMEMSERGRIRVTRIRTRLRLRGRFWRIYAREICESMLR